MSNLGQQGEALVEAWLQSKQAQVLHSRWRSRQAEIDLIAQKQDGTVLFIEVKTRSAGSWDAHGLLAIRQRKQAKIIHGARMFLALNPNLAEQPCRFDVALVGCSPQAIPALYTLQRESGDYLALTNYLVAAFDWEE